ncbi:hypothetical protein PIB30_075041 [Stylosanthes scabra]|uniref:Uncharacterized protein n=1 Tax=Stylosanthes scabra TaxID=79078 RepID=A0ABU6RQN5_9FABA|nr:hypothetical protein [Stylosanthes scabra]
MSNVNSRISVGTRIPSRYGGPVTCHEYRAGAGDEYGGAGGMSPPHGDPLPSLQPSRQYLLWYYQWAYVILTGYRDPVISAPGVIPYYTRDVIPEAPDMVQLEDGELPEVNPRVARRRRAPAGRSWTRTGWTRWESCEGGSASAGAGSSHPTPDTQAGPSHSETPMMQLQIEAPLPLFSEYSVPPPVYHPQPYTPSVDHVPDNYTQPYPLMKRNMSDTEYVERLRLAPTTMLIIQRRLNGLVAIPNN